MFPSAAFSNRTKAPVRRAFSRRFSLMVVLAIGLACAACSGGKPAVAGPADDDADTSDTSGGDAVQAGASGGDVANDDPPTPAEEDIEVPAAP